jgi:hypothetical protein
MKDPLADLHARLQEADLRARLAWEMVEILGAPFARIPEKNRPYYTPSQRFRITEIKNLLAWNAAHTAKAFLLCANTIRNWERSADPTAKTVGSKVSPIPPVRRAADIVRATVQTMTRLGFGGQDLVARTLARAGWTVSARSVARYRKERVAPPPTPPGSINKTARPVIARFVHHTWMMDVSVVKQLLGPDLHIACVFDAFSRVALVLRVFDGKPGAADMTRLLRRAARAFRRPRYLITDLGGEFTGGAFRKAVRRLGAPPPLRSGGEPLRYRTPRAILALTQALRTPSPPGASSHRGRPRTQARPGPHALRPLPPE